MKNKFAFTLAEVLITLVIIGVVAALTITTLIKKTQKQEFVAGLKKANSVLSQSVYKIGQSKGYPVGDYSFIKEMSQSAVVNEFSKVLSVVKKCSNFQQCSGKSIDEYKGLNGNPMYGLDDGPTLVLSDGQILFFSKTSGTYGLSSEDDSNYLARIFVDVNGHKGPNQLGYDSFLLYFIDKKGIVPAGNYSVSACNKSSQGYTCAAKVIKENAINY